MHLVLTGWLVALTAELGLYSRVVAAHIRMGADSHGSGRPVGPQASRNWECLRGLWRAVAPLVARWCADREVLTCANLHFYEGSGSRVRWYSDDEGLFRKRRESKLIVSMSFGASALFKWKPGPSLDSEASSFWLHHGDLLVKDGCSQDEYHHCTEPLQVGNG